MKIIQDFDTIKATNKMNVVHIPTLKRTPSRLYILNYFFFSERFSKNVSELNNPSIQRV